MDFSRQPVFFRLNGADEVEPQQGQIRQVVAGKRLRIEMGVNEPQPLEPALARAELVEAGDHDLPVIPHDDEMDIALAADENADLPVCLREISQRCRAARG